MPGFCKSWRNVYAKDMSANRQGLFFTTKVPDFKATIDYMFVNDVEVEQVLDIPTHSSAGHEEPDMPNENEESDHFPMGVVVTL